MTLRRRFSVLFGVSVRVYGLVVRPRLLHWCATDEELRAPYPGTHLIPGGKGGATMAVTIDTCANRSRGLDGESDSAALHRV